MAETISDISVGGSAWVDVNTASGVAVGTKMYITLKSGTPCRLYESATAPALDSTDGVVLTDSRYPYTSATIPAASLKIWALSTSKTLGLKLSVQEG